MIKMKDDLVKKIIHKSLDLIEENYSNRRLLLSFPQYVSLVQSTIDCFLIDKRWKKDSTIKPIIFTALCITPLQWFNFSIIPKEGIKTINIRSLAEVEKMWADNHWIKYHDFLGRMTCVHPHYILTKKECKTSINAESCMNCISKKRFFECSYWDSCSKNYEEQTFFNFYRYLLTVNSEMTQRERATFPVSEVVKTQLESFYIGFKKDSGSALFSSEELRSKNIPYYQSIPHTEKAYLIVGKNDDTFKDSTIEFVDLGRIFSEMFQKHSFANLNYLLSPNLYKHIVTNNLPEDFIIFGYEKNHNRTWELAIASDVTVDRQFVKVEILPSTENIFNNLVNLINDILI